MPTLQKTRANETNSGLVLNDHTKFHLGGGFTYFFYFHDLFGEMIQFDEHIFQMGGSTTN